MAFKKSLAVLFFALPFVLCSPLATKQSNPACDFLKPIIDDVINNVFDNECGDIVHAALRLTFHDAMGVTASHRGGADGSIITYNFTELQDPANDGVHDILMDLSPIYYKYAEKLSPGDYVQLMGALSLSVCPGAPQVKYVIGRPHPTAPAPLGTVPGPSNTADEILLLFARLGFSPEEVVALLAAHTVGAADDFPSSEPGQAFDSTPDKFDTKFFLEVLLKGDIYPDNGTHIEGLAGSAIQGTARLQSDFALARDSRTACAWQSYALDHELMNAKFADAFYKMGLLGQADNKNLIDCSELIPQPPPLNSLLEFPPQKCLNDIEQRCTGTPFPDLPTAPGRPLDVPPVPQAEGGDS